MQFMPSRLSLAIFLAFPLVAVAEDGTTLDTVVVTAPRMEEPLKVVTDPKATPAKTTPAKQAAKATSAAAKTDSKPKAPAKKKAEAES